MSQSESDQSVMRVSEAQTFIYRRAALRVGSVSIVALLLLGWFGRDTLARLLDWHTGLVLAGFAVAISGLTMSVFTATAVTMLISVPLRRLSEAAESVAAGQMDARISGTRRQGEFGRLARAVQSMVDSLRRTVVRLGDASQETAALAAEITSGTDQMAASASEMATTSSTLSQQSLGMSETIQKMAGDAARLAELSSHVTSGVRDGAARNTQLRALAAENRERLNDSSRALQELSVDADSSASAVEALAASAEEIRAFVTLVQKMARQSKLLALNAAMEAARAGEQGQGFAVVASEVRRLAASSSEAAVRAEALVGAVLERAAESRASSTRTVETVRGVLASTEQGLVSFSQVEEAVRESESWAATVEESAARSDALVTEMTRRLEELAHGTEGFAAAMEQVAASAEQQSASTQQIAAAANSLDASARRLASGAATRRDTIATHQQNDEPEPPPSRARTESATSMRLATA